MGLLTGWTDIGRSERASKGKRFERSSSRLIKYLNSPGIILFRIDLSFNFESGDPSQSGVYCNGDALVLTAAEDLIVRCYGRCSQVFVPSRIGSASRTQKELKLRCQTLF
jgi:hypothetical protein